MIEIAMRSPESELILGSLHTTERRSSSAVNTSTENGRAVSVNCVKSIREKKNESHPAISESATCRIFAMIASYHSNESKRFFWHPAPSNMLKNSACSLRNEDM